MQNTDKNSTIIVIPARMASTRLPNKPLADINGKPMIVHVLNNAKKADIGRVVVATDNEEIAKIIKNNGGEAFMTPSNLSSGTLRVGYALEQITEKYDFVINLQGDMPNIQSDVIHLIKDGLIEYKNADIMTAVYELDKSNNDKLNNVTGIMETLELLKLDMANYTIQQMRPHIQQQVVAYEQKKFKELLEAQKDAGLDGLAVTKEWLARALKRISSSETIGLYECENGATPSAICNEAFMEILVWKSSWPFPETLAMDELRFNEIYVKCRKFLVVCAIINTVYSLVGESIRGLEELRSKLKQHILVLLEDYMAQ